VLRLSSFFELLNQIQDIRPVARADKSIDAGHCLGELMWTALRVAPGGDDALSWPPIPRQLLQDSTRLLSGRLNEAAGVDDQQVGLGRVDG
jgi:hypothetical protein